MNENNKLDHIIETLAEIKSILLTPKRLRSNLKPLEKGETLDRAGDMKRVFSLAASTPFQKKASQHFPQGTYNAKNDRIEIMPRSILVNRCSLRKAFRPTDEELGKKNTPDLVNETLDELIERGFFFQSRLVDAIAGNTSHSLCIFSKQEAIKHGLTSGLKPGKPAKWYPGWEKEWDGVILGGGDSLVDEVPKMPTHEDNTEDNTDDEGRISL